MYYQLFITKRESQKLAQFSCDSMNEVIEVLQQYKPKFIKIEYYDENGLIGTGFQYYNFMLEKYVSYKKIANNKVLNV